MRCGRPSHMNHLARQVPQEDSARVKLVRLLGILLFCLVAFVFVFGVFLPAQGLRRGTPSGYMRRQRELAARFKAGDTNTPLLTLGWFSHGVHFCRVQPSAEAISAVDVGHAIQGGRRVSLDERARQLLLQSINSLPPPPGKSPPVYRQVVVSGIRSNQWFQGVYDRADVPPEVEKLFQITGAYLEWYFPTVEGAQIALTDFGHCFTSQASISAFTVASGAPFAVSSGVNGIQVWDLNRRAARPLLFLKTNVLVDFESPLTVATISPDGGVVALASPYATFAVDWKAERILWQRGPLDQEGCLTKHLAIGGSKGEFLFAAGNHVFERWDVATGKTLALLVTNGPTIQCISVSRDGKTIVAGMNGRACMDMPTSFKVWKANEDHSVAGCDESDPTGVGLSPDGKELVLSVFGEGNLRIWNWRTGGTREVPLRTPYASGNAYSLYWSPDGSRLAAYIDTYPDSIVVYNTSTWKPLAQWCCGAIMSDSKFGVSKDGVLLQQRDHDLNGLDLKGF